MLVRKPSSLAWYSISRLRRSYTPVATAAQQASTEDQMSPVQLREIHRSRTAYHLFFVRGVSFEDRQAVITGVEPGEAVMLIHEPENEYDDNAIAVKLLDGRSLGYVPREINKSTCIRQPEAFGHVRSVGPSADSGLLGVQIEHQPNLLPLVAPAIPPQLQDHCSRLVQQKLNNSSSAPLRCQVTGSAVTAPVPCPVWYADTQRHRLVLQGACFAAPQLCRAQNVLLLGDQADREAALIFQAFNGWTSDELHKYRRHQRELVSKRSEEDWVLDFDMLDMGKSET